MGLYVLTYACALVFVLAMGLRIRRPIALPVHVRWELYPVRHETAERVAYGGSYLEALNWWERPDKRSLWNELKYMAPEILLMRGLWKENRRLWWVSFPFHFGLYLMVAAFGLLLLHALLALGGAPALADGHPLGRLLDGLIVLAGWSGLILGNIGCLGLFYRRLADPELRDYASFADYFNLGFIFLFFLCAFAAGLGDPSLAGARAHTLGLLTAGSALEASIPGPSAAGAAAVVLASLLTAYIPLTHMSHMVMKYFFYHSVKWDDAPNRRGGKIEAAVRENLGLRPTWQARHVGADGRKSWREIAASEPGEMK
jgi:nitrate reductase gamma subunit